MSDSPSQDIVDAIGQLRALFLRASALKPHELDCVAEALRERDGLDNLAGGATLVYIHGETGTGKTALAAHCGVSRAAHGGFAVTDHGGRRRVRGVTSGLVAARRMDAGAGIH